MNISKNLLSLGLIAVISGVSTAQTYTSTAGTGGVTDIQSDYSMSTGDGASVSVNVPLEFELPKKVALSVSPAGSFSLPNNEMFTDIIGNQWGATKRNTLLDTVTPVSSDPFWNNTSASSVNFEGGIYANTPISITFETTDMIHESDPNSIILTRHHAVVNSKGNMGVRYCNNIDGTDSSVSSMFKNGGHSCNIDDSQLIASDNKLGFYIWSRAYLDTIDPTDRAGKYLQTVILTVTTL